MPSNFSLQETAAFDVLKKDESAKLANSPDERADAICALGKSRDTFVIPILIQDLGDDGLTSKPSSCWDEGDWSPLLRTFKQPSPGEEASLALASMGEIALEPLVAALKDSNPSVRRNAAWAIGEIRNGDKLNRTAALEPLIYLLRNDEDAWVRRSAAFALSELKDKRSAQDLIASLKDENPSVREMAANALGEMKEQSAVYALEEALKDQDKRVANMARWSITEIQDR